MPVMLTLLGAAAAAALPPASQKDVACVAIVAMTLGKHEGDEKIFASLTSGLTYYYGRVEALNPGVDMQSVLKAYYAALTPQQLNSDGQRCSGELEALGQRMVVLGKDMKAMDQAPASK